MSQLDRLDQVLARVVGQHTARKDLIVVSKAKQRGVNKQNMKMDFDYEERRETEKGGGKKENL